MPRAAARLALGVAVWCLSLPPCAAAPAVPAAFEQRLDAASARFVGRPYLRSPLGEGEGVDPDPLIRFDAFDCTTYVETVIALARAPGPTGQVDALNRIRYAGGRVGYPQRRHLPEFEWLPQLVDEGVIRDVTAQLGGSEVRYVHKAIGPAAWLRQARPVVAHLDAAQIAPREVDLPYLPLDAANRLLRQLDQVAVLSVVRESRPDVPVVVTHQALLVPGSDGPRVRHARARPLSRVVDEPLAAFVARLRRQRAWPVLGLHVADVVDPAATD